VTQLYLLDTDTVSYALRGQGDVVTNIRGHRPSDLCISAISVAELRFGAESRGSKKLHRALDGFLHGIATVAFDQRAANSFGSIAALLEARGEPIGPLDTMIAAHAISIGATMVTNNTKHFSRVPDLLIENWF
jgi:tRNA(fMet)-specific endonuclease VapC